MRTASNPRENAIPHAQAIIADRVLHAADPKLVETLVRSFKLEGRRPEQTNASAMLALTRLVASVLPPAGPQRELLLEAFFELLGRAFDQVDRPNRREGTFDA